MQVYTHDDVTRLTPYPKLIEQMHVLFAAQITCPDRHNHSIPMSDETDQSLLLMSGWHDNIGCIKIVNVVPDNGKRNLPAIAASLLVFDRNTGEHLAVLDGDAVTVRRTAAASALAARYLAPEDSEHLLILGAGKIAEQLPAAFSSVRPITKISVWNRHFSGAKRLAKQFQAQGLNATAIESLDTVIGEADIISAATLATNPIIAGKQLRGNQHIDLIGSFKPDMREADDKVIKRAAGAIFTDSAFTAKESGELAIPLANQVIQQSDISGDLSTLCREVFTLSDNADITLFKGAGNAVMDLAAAITAMQQ